MNDKAPAYAIAIKQNVKKASNLVPAGVEAKRLTQAFLAAVAADPRLIESTPESLVNAYLDCARLGLWPGPQKHVHIQAYKNKKRGVYEAKAIAGYQGLIVLMKRNADVLKAEARVRFSGDAFQMRYGSSPDLQHVPNIDGERGQPLGAYAVAFFRPGGVQFVYMGRAEIETIRDDTYKWQESPWKSHPLEMWKKTAIRRLAKVVGQDELLAHAFSLEDTLGPAQPAPVQPIVAQAPVSIIDRAIRYSPAIEAPRSEPKRVSGASEAASPAPMSAEEMERIAREEAEQW